MHQHTYTIKLELKTGGEKTVERYCSGCGRKVEFKDSGVRRHNANGKNLTQFAIYKCENGHTWNMKLQDYKASVADEVSDPKSLEREGYRKAVEYRTKEEPACKDMYDGRATMSLVNDISSLRAVFETHEMCTIEIVGEGKRERLDKIICERFEDVSRNQVQRAIARGYIKVNALNAKPSIKLKAGDEISVFPGTFVASDDVKEEALSLN